MKKVCFPLVSVLIIILVTTGCAGSAPSPAEPIVLKAATWCDETNPMNDGFWIMVDKIEEGQVAYHSLPADVLADEEGQLVMADHEGLMDYLEQLFELK